MGASAATQDVATIVKNVKPKLLIDGKFVDAVSGKTFKTVNPHDETVIMEVAEGDAADVDIAVKSARKAFDEGPWPKMPGTERGRIIYKFADLLEEHTDELAALDSLDNGKPFFWAKAADLSHVVAFFRYYAGWADKLTGLTIPTNGPYFGYTLHEPLGVIGAIVPWNFPLLMWTWKVAPALACGNTIIIKTAEQTPLSALRAGELALQAGLPPGVLNIIPGYGPTAGARLSAHPDVDKVSFTGSTEVGALVGAAAAKNIKPCTLELGGKSAAIVWKDVDIDQVVQEAHNALFFNHGQCCAAGSRTFVHEDIYDEFVEKATKLAANKKLGNPLQEGCEQGPQVDEEQFKKIMNYIDQGKAEGAKLNCGGKRKGDKGFYVEPTVFSEVQDHMTIATDEIFGPVQSILKYKTIDEVIRRANQSQFGLASGLWAKDIDVVNTISRGLRAGTVWVNCYNVYDAAMPFGGYKMSGVGRDKGEYALHHYTQTKAVYQQLKDSAWL